MGMGTRRRGSSYWALAAVAAPRTAGGRSQEAPNSGPSREDSARAGTDAGRGPNSPVAPRAVAPAAPEPKVDPISGVAQIESGYTYDPTGKRDPFRSFIWDRPDKMQIAEAGPLGQFDLSQL